MITSFFPKILIIYTYEFQEGTFGSPVTQFKIHEKGDTVTDKYCTTIIINISNNRIKTYKTSTGSNCGGGWVGSLAYIPNFSVLWEYLLVLKKKRYIFDQLYI